MHIRWTKNRVAEQHLEGECRDLEKLKLEIYGVFPNGDGTITEMLAVHSVRSVSDGTLQVFVDAVKGANNG